MKAKVKTKSPVPVPLEHRHKLVLIHWVDSSSLRGTWNSKEDLQQNIPLECVSAGFVMHDTPSTITLAAHITTHQGGGDMTIPKCAITKMQSIGYKK